MDLDGRFRISSAGPSANESRIFATDSSEQTLSGYNEIGRLGASIDVNVRSDRIYLEEAYRARGRAWAIGESRTGTNGRTAKWVAGNKVKFQDIGIHGQNRETAYGAGRDGGVKFMMRPEYLNARECARQ